MHALGIQSAPTLCSITVPGDSILPLQSFHRLRAMWLLVPIVQVGALLGEGTGSADETPQELGPGVSPELSTLKALVFLFSHSIVTAGH